MRGYAERRSNPVWLLFLICVLTAGALAAGVLAGCGAPSSGEETPTALLAVTAAASRTPSSVADTFAAATATAMPTAQAATALPTVTPTATPTVTPAAVVRDASPCDGLAGELEVQVLVGPAAAAGLEPVAVGSVPLAVTRSGETYRVEGQGPIDYEGVLAEEWGSFSVSMALDNVIEGECIATGDGGQLVLVLRMAGEQTMVVESGGGHWEYPWAGAEERSLVFPLEEGATESGEGWAVVLHLLGQ